MREPVTTTIHGVEVICIPLPEYPRGGVLLGELIYVAMPALKELASTIGSKVDLAKLATLEPSHALAAVSLALGEDGAGKLVGALEGSLHRLLREDPATATRLIGTLLSSCMAVVPRLGGGQERVDLNTDAKIQQAIDASGASYRFFGALLKFALGANFAGPFAGAFAGASSATRSASPTPTP